MTFNKKIIVITGASTGIGFDAALTLTKRGHRVIATCRKLEDIQRLNSLGIEAIPLDLNDFESITEAFEKVMEMTGGKLDVLINNAGYGQSGALEDLKPEYILAQFQTNVFGLMSLTRLAIPVMRKAGEGRIINVSSVLGVVSLPFKGAYNASKYAVEGISDTLRLELKPAGIQVITIEPGPIQSDWSQTATETFKNIDVENSVFKKQYEAHIKNATQKKSDSAFTKPASAVTNKMIHAIESKHPKPKYPVTFAAHFLIFLRRILPTWLLDKWLLQISKIS
jgi:NAD(P)-dependent dehydrogenase (short-subunit alcohol dehydrogenase family)